MKHHPWSKTWYFPMTYQLSPLSPTSYYFASYLPTLLFQPTAFPEMNQQLLFRAVELIGESLTCFEKWIDLHNQLHCVGCCQQNFGEMSASWQKKNCGERRQRTKRSLTGLYRNFVRDKKNKNTSQTSVTVCPFLQNYCSTFLEAQHGSCWASVQ